VLKIACGTAFGNRENPDTLQEAAAAVSREAAAGGRPAVEMRRFARYVQHMPTPSPLRTSVAAKAVDPRVVKIVTELRRQLEALYGDRLERVVLYGSQARGDADTKSDIDVLVVLQGEVRFGEEIRRTTEIVGDLALQNHAALSRVFVSAERFAEDQSPFLMNVRREGIMV
jgi:uncharacterized protein